MNPLLAQLLGRLPMEQLLPAYALWQRLSPKKASELTVGDVRDVLKIFNVQADNPKIEALLQTVEDGSNSSVEQWMSDRAGDGSFERLLHPAVEKVLMRCPHCDQPNDVPVDVELIRCVHCDQPFTNLLLLTN